MTFVPVTVLGGLPVIADVWFSGPDYQGEYDAGVDDLFWQKSDGSRGKKLSENVMRRIERQTWWQCDVIERANDWLGYAARDENDNLTPEYLKLNPRKVDNGLS